MLTATRRRVTGALVTSAAMIAALVGSVAPAQAHGVTLPVVLSAGHVDVIDVEYEDGELELGVHDDSVEPAAHRDHSDVVFVVKSQARTTVPTDPAFAFLGAAGSPVWILPQVENEDLLFAGIATEELEEGVFAGDSIDLTVQQLVSAPSSAHVAVYTEDLFGQPSVLTNSRDGLPDVVDLPVGDHLHANWAFSKPGVYLLKAKASATLAGTTTVVESDSVQLRFVVLP
ncbi:choice-of-anchor M domain-containing protein [Micromonospora sp. WMMD1082]|uniref:choice-of-anchor M domain-containing protein n=1 Tax=Micromonospora sp. WMMD1082 TaxID=3016104 RepID=UPI0024174B56|nr:choice-of-anchor M domain-containing protein [Micromonospora sp. WMMD1082]MDG4793274.1 choice-of-anchor M domain-containing protein [Micromonospora sp. WMMD1082]